MAAAGAPLRAIQDWLGHADAAPDATNDAALVERAFGPAAALESARDVERC